MNYFIFDVTGPSPPPKRWLVLLICQLDRWSKTHPETNELAREPATVANLLTNQLTVPRALAPTGDGPVWFQGCNP